MANATTVPELPPLPEYTIKPLAPLIEGIPDSWVQAALPVIAYWAVSLFFHLIDVYDLFPQHRLHTPAEVLKRNHVTRYEVFRDVIFQQVIQTIAALTLDYFDDAPTTGTADYDVAWYAQKVRLAQRAIPMILATVGLNPAGLASKISASQPMLAAAVSGGRYPGLMQVATIAGHEAIVPTFASWELAVARFLYWYAVPTVQFCIGILIIDTWEYALHRAMHQNKWLYATFHSRHHRLYVPYAYGALYNHPIEGFLLDTLGGGLAYLIMGMTVRQSMWFFTGSTIKTVLDHSGYEFPYDPVNWIFPNNAAYHDIHHQSWGIKTNFSQPFFIFWDRLGGTMWKGDTASKYERARRAAQLKVDQENENKATATAQAVPAPRSTRKKASSISQASAGNLKGLTNKVNESLHGKRASVLGLESSH